MIIKILITFFPPIKPQSCQNEGVSEKKGKKTRNLNPSPWNKETMKRIKGRISRERLYINY